MAEMPLLRRLACISVHGWRAESPNTPAVVGGSWMSLDWATTITTLGGVATALIGVVAGSLLTSRSERTHWARDKQIAACSAIVAESTRIQLALRRAWKHGDPVDWVPWNVALGTVWLVGSPAVVDAAARVDEVFWECSDQFIRQVALDEQSWGEARDVGRLNSGALGGASVGSPQALAQAIQPAAWLGRITEKRTGRSLGKAGYPVGGSFERPRCSRVMASELGSLRARRRWGLAWCLGELACLGRIGGGRRFAPSAWRCIRWTLTRRGL